MSTLSDLRKLDENIGTATVCYGKIVGASELVKSEMDDFKVFRICFRGKRSQLNFRQDLCRAKRLSAITWHWCTDVQTIVDVRSKYVRGTELVEEDNAR